MSKEKMGKIFKSKKKSKSKISNTREEIKMFFCKLQQTVIKECCNNGEISQDFTSLYTASDSQTSPKENSTSVHTPRKKNSAYDNNYCQRCKRLLEVPPNILSLSEKRMPSFIETCEIELTFIQAVIWLKSITSYVPQIPVEKLQQLFDNQCNKRDKNKHAKNVHVESSSAIFANKTPLVHDEMLNNNENFMLSLNNILDSSCNISLMTHESNTNFEDIQNELFSFVSSLKDQNESVTEILKPETSTGYVMTNEERKAFLSQSYLIPDVDKESLSDLTDMFEESVTYNNVDQFLQNFEKTNSKQTSQENCNNRVNNEIIEDENINFTLKNDADISSQLNFVSLSRCQSIESILNFEKTNGKQTSQENCNNRINNEIIEDKNINSTLKNDADISSQLNFVSLSRCQSIESILNLKYNSDQYDETNNMEMSNNNIINFLTQLSITDINDLSQISLISCSTPREHNDCNNFQTDQMQSKTLHDYNDADFEHQTNNKSPCVQISDAATEDEKNDSAYSTWQIETVNHDTATTKPIANKPVTNTIKHQYNLRHRKEKVITNKEVTASSSLIQKSIYKEQHSMEKSSSKKRKSKPAKNVSEKTKKNKKMISANWLNFTVELLNAEHVIYTSVKTIVSAICDKKTAQLYVQHRCWKDTLEEEAVNAVLNIVDILKTEKKPNICEDLIETAIIKTLDEMITSIQLETSIWVFHLEIILQFCQLLTICIKTINYLIAMLESVQSVLLNTMNRNEIRIMETNQLHLIFYAFDIALRKYCELVPRDKKSQFQLVKTAIPCIEDRWKIHYKKKNKFEDVDFDLDAIEKQWLNVLQKFTVVSVKHSIMAPFANVSFLLYNILISV
ncbi:uncharacterized protein LOC114936836 [Nylanderia fulva]|uniref:uncharacterized protein LOC114936836 n=1 Tax=Nylanderia fulva TaxID=613905 RepID=UPI0010FAF838|nr:uncharacterized protein LOC114936836 [Nylanderia fulva]